MCQHWHPFDIPGSPTLRFISFLEEVKIAAVILQESGHLRRLFTLINGLSAGVPPFPYSGCCYEKEVPVGTYNSAV